jgi:hypothetical protein
MGYGYISKSPVSCMGRYNTSRLATASNPTCVTIQASATRYHELVRGMGALDYARPAFERCTFYSKELQLE